MNKTRLSICIPTFNRVRPLQECLASIAEQFSNQDIAEQVEVVVSDNASSDGTRELVTGLQEKWPQLKYFRNQDNLGFDRNVLAVVERAEGEYCWLMGDDDAFFPKSLSVILKEISESDCAYYHANTWGYDSQLKQQALTHPNLFIGHNRYFATLSDFVAQIGSLQDVVGYFGGMSGQIFKRALWEEQNNKEEFIGSQAIHLFVLLAAMKNQAFAQLSQPLVKTRAENMRWETFPGLETYRKRVRETEKALLWIRQKYNLPHSRWRIKIFFLWQTLSGGFVFSVKKYIFTNPQIRHWVGAVYKKVFRK